MKKKLYTKQELIKKYKGKYIKVYPHHYETRQDDVWITTYEVQGISNKLKENYNLPEEAVI